jgi:hypothetical protein
MGRYPCVVIEAAVIKEVNESKIQDLRPPVIVDKNENENQF